MILTLVRILLFLNIITIILDILSVVTTLGVSIYLLISIYFVMFIVIPQSAIAYGSHFTSIQGMYVHQLDRSVMLTICIVLTASTLFSCHISS